jgi:nucleoside-diphosphate-sugar epimerase
MRNRFGKGQGLYFCVMTKRVLVVGAGWLGKPLAMRLKERGHGVRVTATSSAKVESLQQSGLEAMLLHVDAAGSQPELPFADVMVVTVPPRGGQQQSEQALGSLAAAACRAHIPFVVYCSSTGVYPDLNREVGVEDAQDFPSRHSGVRLLALEHLFCQNHGFLTTVLRLGGLHGPGREAAAFLNPELEHAGADNPVNMAHLDDCLQALVEAVESDPVSKVKNVVSVPHLSRREFYARACKAAGLPEPNWNDFSLPWKRVMPDR